MLLDQNYKLKISDFGLAKPLEGDLGNGWLYTECGTRNFMTPEQNMKQPYNGEKVDLFAAAVSLFFFVAGLEPFEIASADDQYYVAFV